jgi:aconitate hydratase
MAWNILEAHNQSSDPAAPRLKFDALTAHDITYVGIIQTARASGMTEFPIPIAMTNCHNSLCAVGGTINQDDHMFALSAAKKYGGIYVPPHLAVMHSYNREMMAKCGSMLLGSDSQTRYGALGTMAVGEGGGELAKQLLGRTYDCARPQVIAVYLTGALRKGVGAHDVAIALVGATYQNGYVKNKVMEFIGDGIANLPIELRNGIDVMTTETTCWSSIWETDAAVRDYYALHGRPQDYKQLSPGSAAYYDGMVYIDLSKIEPMIAMPFHPSNAYTIRELKANAADILAKVEKDCMAQLSNKNLSLNLRSKLRGGDIYVEQGVVAGCAGGTFDNICDVADIVEGKSLGSGAFTLSVYPGSQPAYMELVKNGAVAKIMAAGGIVRSAFCGPCFGAGDTPANGELSVRHTTRNFPNREGSKPGEGQIATVALMDAHSVAATAVNGGRLTAATELDTRYSHPKYFFDKTIYENRVYNGFGKAEPGAELKLGPNIKDWPAIPALTEHLLLRVVSYITDPVTTTDELIPSGETSSFRSNPLRLAEFTLSRKDPAYVGRAKEVNAAEVAREQGKSPLELAGLKAVYDQLKSIPGYAGADPMAIGIGSTIYALRPGDGSAREQAASCQRVLGAWANICLEYATKRYRSNLINWGMLPLQLPGEPGFRDGDYIFIPGIRSAVESGKTEFAAYVLGAAPQKLLLTMAPLTDDEKKIVTAGCLINYYRG